MRYIDSQVAPIIENMRKFREERGPVNKIPVEEMRINFKNDVEGWNSELPDIGRVSDFSLATGFGDIAVRLYDPNPSAEQLATMLFIHGGGWIVGDLDTNEKFLRLLAQRSGLKILSLDYPLAPENPFPVALDCIVEIVRIVFLHGHKWGIDSDRLCIGGDSAGANLALCAALDLKNSNENILQHLSLIYGAFSPNPDKPSFAEFGQGEYGMGVEAMQHFWDHYLQQAENKKDPRAVPLLADVSGLPAVHIITGGLDPLQDDSFELVEKLKSADVKYNHAHYPGMIHGFVSLCDFINEGNNAITDLSVSLKAFVQNNKRSSN